MKKLIFIILCIATGYLTGCQNNKKTDQGATTETVEAQAQTIQTPAWAKNANIYEVNIRQYTPEGTLAAFRQHLPRLRNMGVDILWFMPIFPISETKRKGSLGSYYAISDFRDVNPEFGTLREFQEMVVEIHNSGMHVILDWVPNHTGWDHVWLTEHPDYYTTDSTGQVIDPINPGTGESWGWTDVADLNYDNQAMRAEMIADMRFWIDKADIDGFRCDVAGAVPMDFWETVNIELAKSGKPLFMLAEAEEAEHLESGVFDMNYAWEFHHLLNDLAQGKRSVNAIDTVLAKKRKKMTRGYQMYFTSNHDENSWAGTVFERMGDAHLACAVLAATIDGMPLIYSGQEEPLRKRLAFFEKDEIPWGDFAYADFYTRLLKLKKRNSALWNGQDGARAVRINTSEHVYAFRREQGGHRVYVIINFSDVPRQTTIEEDTRQVKNILDGDFARYKTGETIALEPWGYLVLSNI